MIRARPTRPTPVSGPLAALLTWPIQAYRRWLSPVLPARCRYLPTCSDYAVQALRQRGAVLGSALAVWRILRCHPLAAGGYDPVPPGRAGADRRNCPAASSVQCATPPSGVLR